MNIIFDLDGTLLNSLPRLYELFCRLNPKNNFSYDEYWQLKRQKINQEKMLMQYFNYSLDEAKIFHKKWLEGVENKELLELDKPYEKAGELLKKLAKNHDIYIATARQNEDLALKQIEKFGWIGDIKKLLVTQQIKTKEQIIKENIDNITSQDVIIGDTGEDIITGKNLGIKTIAVISGFLSKDSLNFYKPDAIEEGVKSIYLNSTIEKIQNEKR